MTILDRILQNVGLSKMPSGDGAKVSDDQVSVAYGVQSARAALARENERLERAVLLLQNAAFLANYHQPSLARDIRSFIKEVQADGIATDPLEQSHRNQA